MLCAGKQDVLALCRFRKLALIYHPDRNTSNTAKQDFFQICEAYDILSHRELVLPCTYSLVLRD